MQLHEVPLLGETLGNQACLEDAGELLLKLGKDLETDPDELLFCAFLQGCHVVRLPSKHGIREKLAGTVRALAYELDEMYYQETFIKKTPLQATIELNLTKLKTAFPRARKKDLVLNCLITGAAITRLQEKKIHSLGLEPL